MIRWFVHEDQLRFSPSLAIADVVPAEEHTEVSREQSQLASTQIRLEAVLCHDHHVRFQALQGVISRIYCWLQITNLSFDSFGMMRWREDVSYS